MNNMINLSEDELTKEIYKDFKLDPKLHRVLKFACWFLWGLAALQGAKLYFKSASSFEITLAISCALGAVGVTLMYWWSSKSGYMEKIRKEGK